MKTCSEYRRQSKEMLTGKWGIAIGVTVIFSIILGASAATVLGPIILGGALTVGYMRFFMRGYRENSLEFGDLFSAFDNNFTSTLFMYLLMNLFIFLWSLLFIIPGIIASYAYSMAPMILADNPEMGGYEALQASKELMRGKKGQLFLLHLSYIGWILLSIPTLGILMLWVAPWMEAATVAFYEDIKGEVKTEQNIA
ncbi:MAG: DUF975 family protein [Lachnospiraceae bacterium]|nr:DUF975 family protein [Lachnospiraceae bacterium]